MKHEFAVKLRGGAITRPTTLRVGGTHRPPTFPRAKGKAEIYRQHILGLCPGSEEFAWVPLDRNVFRAARMIGAKIRVRKDELGRGWQVWRLT